MSDFSFAGPGWYRQRDGRKAWVAGPNRYGNLVGEPDDGALSDHWYPDGRTLSNQFTPCDLIAPWTEPKKGTVWVNVFRRQSGKIGFAGHFASRAKADADAALARVSVRIACVSVNWTEGEGL